MDQQAPSIEIHFPKGASVIDKFRKRQPLMLSGNENVMCNALQETSWSKPPEVAHALAKALKVKALKV